MVVIARANDTVDSICWRHYKKTVGIVELVYELNPNLSKQTVFLKEGTQVKLPVLKSEPQIKPGVKLW